jgi:hypothetical protein
MKARVKETGEIVEVEFVERKTHTGEQVYMTHEGCLIEESRLDFNVEPIDYWTRLEHQYAGMAMQAMLTSPELMQVVTSAKELLTNEYAKRVAVVADRYAHALVEKLKEKEERK